MLNRNRIEINNDCRVRLNAMGLLCHLLNNALASKVQAKHPEP